MNAANEYTLFLDLDGVLVDFERGVVDVTGKHSKQLSAKQMWPRLARSPNFYASLNWMADGPALWSFCRDYFPIILTGIPMGKWAEPQKRSWCENQLGPDVEVIVCLSRHKAKRARERESRRIPVLVDDREKLREAWQEMGGVFIHHTSAATSIAALEKLGF